MGAASFKGDLEWKVETFFFFLRSGVERAHRDKERLFGGRGQFEESLFPTFWLEANRMKEIHWDTFPRELRVASNAECYVYHGHFLSFSFGPS